MTIPGADSVIYLRGSPQEQISDLYHKSQHQHGSHLGSEELWNNNPGRPVKDPLVVADRPIGEWNTLKIRLARDRVTIHLSV